MILKIDASQLEWRTYLEWSRDLVGINELNRGMDIHFENQTHFKLPTRLISKTFLFRWIYLGSAWAYANDLNFMSVSSDPKYWQKVIDSANEKYNILYNFQQTLIEKAQKGEIIQIPSGRRYKFSLKQSKTGEYYWDIKQIVNYPNQGFAADLMVIARVSLYRRLKSLEFDKHIKVFNTVHDNIEVDVDNSPELLYNISIIMENVLKEVPDNFQRLYKTEFITPLAGEVSFGMNLKELKKFDRSKGEKQFYDNES